MAFLWTNDWRLTEEGVFEGAMKLFSRLLRYFVEDANLTNKI